ncbi:hypothetical protein H4582DRAFT_2024880 [Lactarius indigo]|nr:hypothetical protein H4582DRAFT_2024880 [Lactarius indigo]
MRQGMGTFFFLHIPACYSECNCPTAHKFLPSAFPPFPAARPLAGATVFVLMFRVSLVTASATVPLLPLASSLTKRDPQSFSDG